MYMQTMPVAMNYCPWPQAQEAPTKEPQEPRHFVTGRPGNYLSSQFNTREEAEKYARDNAGKQGRFIYEAIAEVKPTAPPTVVKELSGYKPASVPDETCDEDDEPF